MFGGRKPLSGAKLANWVSFWRTLPSTISSAPFHQLRVTPPLTDFLPVAEIERRVGAAPVGHVLVEIAD